MRGRNRHPLLTEYGRQGSHRTTRPDVRSKAFGRRELVRGDPDVGRESSQKQAGQGKPTIGAYLALGDNVSRGGR